MDIKFLHDSASQGVIPTSHSVMLFLDSLSNITEEECFSVHRRSTVLQGLPFGGVPTVLALNFIFWMFLLLIFSCIRKAAWDYGRLALLMDNDSFFPPSTWNSYNLTSLFYGEQSEKEKSPSETSPLEHDSKDVGFCSWLILLYQMKDEEIESKCGIDATTYLSFQRHILVLQTIICFLSVTVILPVNFSGNLMGTNPATFGRTTIVNVQKDDRLLWLHSIFALLYFIITVVCMAHHSVQLEYKEDERVARTLMVTKIPKTITDPNLVIKHFHEAYPSCTVTGVQFCSDVRKLMKLDSERRKAMKGRLYFATKAQKEGKIMIKIHPCSRIFCCRICGFEEVDAEQYYAELEEKLTDEFGAELSRITLKRLDMAFVTFQDERMTATILKDYRRIHCRKHPQQSSVTTVVKSHSWSVSYAPAPNDIIWENLSVRGISWWMRFVLLNISLFVLLFFLTTPAIVVNTIDRFNVTRPVETLKTPIITQFFSTLMLWAFSVLLPFIVYYSAFFETHWRRSTENQITMHKCYFFLVFMVIVLPSLGLTSLDLFFRWLFDTSFVDKANIKFQCVFLPDNGAFFVNYVITASMIGTAMELLRIPGLVVYATRLCFAKSEPERLHVKRSQAYQFQFGLNYAWTSCIFSVVMTYSITCPIIVPFGLLYMLLKHMVDRYNIYYVYIPTKLSQRIHIAAVSQVVVAPILCMFWLLFFSILRLGLINPITLFTCVVLIACILISCCAMCLKKLQPKKPSSYQMFVAAVLQESELNLTPAASPAHQSYGAMGSHLEQVESMDEGGLQSFETELESTEGEYRTGPVLDNQTRYH